MILSNLDSIVRRTLLERGLPIHYYSEVLYHESAAIRELAKDSMQIVNFANLTINSYGAADLPGDFVDDIGVSIPIGNSLQPVPKKSTLNPLRTHDTTTGQFIQPYNVGNTGEQTVFGIDPAWVWFWNINDWGEPTGRYFGSGGGSHLNSYQIFLNRRQIQVTSTFTSPNIILAYISDGQQVDNATQVDIQAIRAIQTYADWMMSPMASIHRSPQAATFYQEKRLYRANKNDLTKVDIIEIMRTSYTATIKS